MNYLSDFINTKVRLGNKSIENIRLFSSEHSCEKGGALVKIGGYCNQFFIINKGLVKLSFETEDGEFIMRFFQENIMFTELESLSSNRPSRYKIIALEDVDYTSISKENFEQLCASDPKIATFYSKFLTMAHINMMNRISEMLESDARTRYTNFVEQNGELVNRIKLGELSRYLGVNQVTLSRIRRKV